MFELNPSPKGYGIYELWNKNGFIPNIKMNYSSMRKEYYCPKCGCFLAEYSHDNYFYSHNTDGNKCNRCGCIINYNIHVQERK